MRKVSAKRKVRKTRKVVDYTGSGSDGNVDLEADENGGKNDESSENESDKSKTVKRKSKKNGKEKVEEEKEAENVEGEKPEDDKGEDNPESAEEEGESEEEYEVQEIVDHKVEKGATLYLIRWKGYGPESDTWEPEDTLSCPDMVSKFLKKVKGKKTASPAKGKKGRSVAPKKAPKRKAEEKEDSEPVDPDKEWEVERIIDYGYEKGVRLFRIRWRGYSAKFDTWEPEEHLNCHEMIEKFLERVEEPNVEQKELRERPKRTERFGGDTYRRGSKRHAGKTRTVYYEEDD